MAKAKTFLDDNTAIQVDVLVGPNANGLCKVAYGNRVLVRHVDRLEPIGEEAQTLLRR